MRNNGEVLKRINLAILGYLAKKGHRKAKWAKMADLEADFTETTYKGKTGTARLPQFGHSRL